MTNTTDQAASPPKLTASQFVTGGGRVDAREIFRMLNRRKWQLLGITALVCAVTGLILSQITPQYRATALVMLDSRKAKVTNTTDVLGGIATDIPAMQTEIEVLRSATLLGRVVDKLRLESDPEYGAARRGPFGVMLRELSTLYASMVGSNDVASPSNRAVEEGPRARAIAVLQSNLVIASRGRSYVISIAVDSRDGAKARRIVDAITDFYLVDQLQAKLDANKRATEFFNDRLEELRRSVETAERAAATYREKAGLTIGKDSTIASQSLSELSSQLIQARTQRADRESRLIALQQAARSPATLGGVSEVLANPLISSLRTQEAEVARRVGDLNQRYGEGHPRMLQTRAEQGQIQGRIAQEVAKILSSLQGDVEAARSKEAELQAQVTALETKAGGLGQSEVQLRQLEREAQSSRAVYEDFLKRFKELREQQDIQQTDSRVLSPANVSIGPVSPRYGLILALALVGGLMLGGITIGVIERLDGGFRTGDQIESFTGRPLVGMIPGLSKLTLGGLSPSRFVVENPASLYAESLRSALTAVMLGSLDKPPKVIMVTSSLPEEGKTTFVCSLGGLMARSNPERRVVVVDCDLRRSSLLERLGVPKTGGTLDEYLSGAKTIEEIIGRDEKSGLHYVPARSGTPNSAEILGSKAMGTFIGALSEQFDIILLDTPPLMAVTDARIAAKLADYVMFIVRWEQTARELAVNALKLLRDVNKNVGIVLAQVNVRRHARYGYGDYGSYYAKYRSYYTN